MYVPTNSVQAGNSPGPRRPVIRTDHGTRHHHAEQRPYLDRLEAAFEEALRRAFAISDRRGAL